MGCFPQSMLGHIQGVLEERKMADRVFLNYSSDQSDMWPGVALRTQLAPFGWHGRRVTGAHAPTSPRIALHPPRPLHSSGSRMETRTA